MIQTNPNYKYVKLYGSQFISLHDFGHCIYCSCVCKVAPLFQIKINLEVSKSVQHCNTRLQSKDSYVRNLK